MSQQQTDNAGVEISVGYFFATPVAAVMLPNAEAINADLRARVLAQRKREPGKNASNRGGWHSAEPTENWAAESAQAIVSAGEEVANQMTMDRQGTYFRPRWESRAWANINGPGDANDFHYHPGSFWSGTYYVDDGGCAADASLGGEFEIMDPRGTGVAMHDPSLVMADGAQNSGGTTMTFTPRSGLLLLFPAWLQHQVRPYYGDRERISFAFNLSRAV